jgi:hypothetical protein
MRQRLAFTLCCIVSASAFAQAAIVQEPVPLDPKRNQKIERIHVEDDSVAIDETRYAGQTESVTVQPKHGLPAYEIVPSTPARPQVYDNRRTPSGGERVWNIFSF